MAEKVPDTRFSVASRGDTWDIYGEDGHIYAAGYSSRSGAIAAAKQTEAAWQLEDAIDDRLDELIRELANEFRETLEYVKSAITQAL